ncbi:MAG: 2-nitropropane dioxygenase [Blastocatellales bacterium]
MNETRQLTIICPCCEATIQVDAETGAIISSQEKAKPTASFDEMKKELDRQKQLRDQIFAQAMGSEKDRERILEEKFREAFKNADKDKDKGFKNPLDLD